MLCRLWVPVILAAIAASQTMVHAAGFLETPDACMAVQRLQDKAIHLVRVGVCAGTPGRVYVEAQPGESRELVVDGVSLGIHQIRPLEMVDVSAVIKRAEEDGKKMVLPENPHKEAMGKAATQTKAFYDSEAFQAQLKAETERIAGASSDTFSAYYVDAAATPTAGMLSANERIYVFVSSSMPLHVLRTYARDISRLGDPRIIMVMRGFMGGMTKIVPTMNLITDVLKKEPSCSMVSGTQCEVLPVQFIIDPLLFRRYAVHQVPTFVHAQGVTITDPDRSEGDGSNTTAATAVSIAGDVSLKYVIDRFRDASAQSRK